MPELNAKWFADAKSVRGTAFHSACKIGCSEMAESLIEKFPDLDIDIKWS